jgi:hypothetical protein
MTMQIALRAKGGLVVASDTKIRTTEQEFTAKPDVPLGITNSPKVRISKRHDVIVALAGWGAQAGDPARDLAEYLSEQDAIPDAPVDLLRGWGNRLFQEKYPSQKHDFPLCTIMVVNPHTEYCAFWKLRVRRDSDDQCSSTYLVNGNENNSAIFWPEYFRCDKDLYDIQATTRIAAFTILMAAELNPFGVGGLEIWQFDKDWHRVPHADIEHLKAQFIELRNSIHSAVLGDRPHVIR